MSWTRMEHNLQILIQIEVRASAIETDVTVTESDSAGDWLTDFYVAT